MENQGHADLGKLAERVQQIQDMVDELREAESASAALRRENQELKERLELAEQENSDLEEKVYQLQQDLDAAVEALDTITSNLDVSGLGRPLAEKMGEGGGLADEDGLPESYETSEDDDFESSDAEPDVFQQAEADTAGDELDEQEIDETALEPEESYGFSSREEESSDEDKQIIDEYLEERERDVRPPRIKPPGGPLPDETEQHRTREKVSGMIEDFVEEQGGRPESLRDILGVGLDQAEASGELDDVLDQIEKEVSAPEDEKKTGLGENIDRIIGDMEE